MNTEAQVGDPTEDATPPEAPPTESTGRLSGPDDGLLPPAPRLVALSFLMLFVELALIRWLGANVIYLSYFSNLVLLGSFLGIGLGFLWSNRSARSLYMAAPVLVGALVLYVREFPVPLQVETKGLVFFTTIKPASSVPREVVLSILFAAVALVLATIGNGVARTFAKFEPLDAYKWDLVGSVLGIATFSALSFLGARPVVWGVIIALVFLTTLPLRRPLALGALALGLVLLFVPLISEMNDASKVAKKVPAGVHPNDAGVIWSPYYKLDYWRNTEGGYNAEVNQSPHWAQIHSKGNPLYESIYKSFSPPKGFSVLVIGAGSGNDVATALRHGAGSVDAVEIDRRLIDVAKRGQPDHAYDDPRVTVHINDGRAYLERSSKKWDLILLALPDSLTLVQGQSSVRLESYLFTQEAMKSVQEHLTPNGAFAMYNFYRQSWLVERLANTLGSVFKQDPCVTQLGEFNLAVLVATDSPTALDCKAPAKLTKATSSPEPVTDDHPFPYLEHRNIPTLYLQVIGLILIMSIVGVRLLGGPLSKMTPYADLFFMGVAFLLLETKSVVQFALLFGTTWFVNSLVFLGVLLSVLAAVFVSRRVSFRNPQRLYAVLLVALLLAWVIPPSALLQLSLIPRFFAATALAFFPVFTANLVFTERFKHTGHSTLAFGANLVGSMIGGCLEYTAMVMGYRNLLLIVALVYGLAFLTGRNKLVGAPAGG